MKEEMIPVILDCDCTMGVPGCDVDDGIALLYLLGCPNVKLLGVTCAYGNNTQETVYNNTRRLMKQFRREDIPVFRGANSADAAGDEEASPAAEFLAKSSRDYDGNLVLLATGSMSNLKEAERLSPGFLNRLSMISVMGGITEKLFVNGVPMDELNLSCDPAASMMMLNTNTDVRIASAQESQHSFIPAEELEQAFKDNPGELADFLKGEMEYWFDMHRKVWHMDGIVCWDVMAAVQAINPEFLQHNKMKITPSESSLNRGLLLGDGKSITVDIPTITDNDRYINHVYNTIFNANVMK